MTPTERIGDLPKPVAYSAKAMPRRTCRADDQETRGTQIPATLNGPLSIEHGGVAYHVAAGASITIWPKGFAAKKHLAESPPETPGLREAAGEVLASAVINGPGEGLTMMVAQNRLDQLAAALDTPPNREGVVLVPLPREAVEWGAKGWIYSSTVDSGVVTEACRQALGESGGEQ